MIWDYVALTAITFPIACFGSSAIAYYTFGKFKNATEHQKDTTSFMLYTLWFSLIGIGHFIIQGVFR
jgi:hypothetical protein